MNILEKIIKHKAKEVAKQKAKVSTAQLERSPFFTRPVLSLRRALTRPESSGIIAEIKRAAPSTGTMQTNIDVGELAKGYARAGAAALSILTDQKFFQGVPEDIQAVRHEVDIPILRKDFIIDPYQILEARSIGADCILLIAAALEPAQLMELARFAQSLDLEVLLEVHSRRELIASLNEYVDMVGVNNRNLEDFTINLDTSRNLAPSMPKGTVSISESGITQASEIEDLRRHGYQGFLIGSHFMKQAQPEQACASLIAQLTSQTPAS